LNQLINRIQSQIN
jgi:hypothetical protein